MFENLKSKILTFYHKHEKKLEMASFVGGFIFDAVMVSEPDEHWAVFQQILYLFIIGSLIHHELLFRLHKWRPVGRWIQFWNYRNLLLHFLLGSLLNVYSIFYIKSASLLNSFFFLAVMIGFIFANELPTIKKSKVSFKVGLYAICLFSFLSILFPILLGYVGWLPFGLSLASTLIVFYIQFKLLKKRIEDGALLLRALLFPGISVLVIFYSFYVLGWIPPVPLSAKEQGVYHLIEKRDGRFLLSTEKIWWKFWQSGDQDFKAQPGDKIYFYCQIYSPTRFADEVFIHWLWKDPKHGWQSADKIPMKIVGGRKEGFRGYAIKSNYQPGDWRVQVETSTGQEISRLYFEVTSVPLASVRDYYILSR